MKQRLGIAAALLTDPELVLLDEPTNGLDPEGMFEIRQLIHRLAVRGKTIFLSSHLLNEVQQVCNKVAILQKGNLIKQGNVRELLRGSEQVLVRLNTLEEIQQAKTILEAAKQQGADWISEVHVQMDRHGQSTLLVDTPKSYSTEINAILARNHLFVSELHPYEGSLEEVFLQLTTPSAPYGSYRGMAALAGGSAARQSDSIKGPERSGDGKESIQ
jgi:ABC-2 type transport system ATP-binding protein